MVEVVPLASATLCRGYIAKAGIQAVFGGKPAVEGKGEIIVAAEKFRLFDDLVQVDIKDVETVDELDIFCEALKSAEFFQKSINTIQHAPGIPAGDGDIFTIGTDAEAVLAKIILDGGLAADIGTNAVISAARAFGLGEKTGIDLGVDMAGTVPDGEWKMRMYGERWYPGDLPQMAIGQGMLLASPLQMARVAGAIGTGYLVVPRLKLDIPVRREPLPFSKKQLDVVREGMRMVVDGGTGRRGGERVAAAVSGKTGTAEIGRGETRRKNAWFLAFAPSEAPSAAVAMIIENGESGGGTAAPRVRNVLAAMFGETGTKEAAKR
jgi:hypothetical protein